MFLELVSKTPQNQTNDKKARFFTNQPKFFSNHESFLEKKFHLPER